jgi:predicted FMN-binding regulatory protein PaiB
VDEASKPANEKSEKLLETYQYLEKVEVELKRREQIVNRIAAEISELEVQLMISPTIFEEKTLSAMKLKSISIYRNVLKAKIKLKQNEREAAIQDMKKALDRKKIVEQEILELQKTDE